MPVISLQNRCKIIQYYLLNKTIFFIQKRLKINKSTIWKIIGKWKRNGTVENAKKPGRVRKSDKLTERTIIKTSRGNPFLNSTQIAREVSPFLKISSSLVRKILVRHGLRANENGFRILENWPPQSPDLNIIENVWSYLKRRVSKRNPKCLEELIRFSFQEFSKIPTVYIQKLYRSVPRRLQLAIKKKGFCTKY